MNSTDSMYGAAPKRFQMPLCDKIISTEVSGDYTLPDYQPEIRRVLRVDATVLPPAKYIGGTNAEFNGTLDYQMLYIGSDGALYSAPLSAEYAFNAPLDLSGDFDLNEGVLLLVDSSDENITTRVSGPRKLSIKCRLLSHVRAYGMMVAEERCSGETDPMSIERLMGSTESSMLSSEYGETIELSEEINGISENMRVISACADVSSCEVTPSDGSADIRGEISLILLVCQDEGGKAETIEKRIPFNDQVELDGITPASFCSSRTHISDISINVDEGKIVCNLSIIPELRAYRNQPLEYTKDLYSTKNNTESAYRSYTIPKFITNSRGNFSQSERIPLSETSLQQDSRIVDMRCRPSVKSYDIDKNKVVLLGECKYSMITEADGDYSTYEQMIPFRYETDGGASDIKSVFATVSPISCRGRIDGNNLSIDTELSVFSDLFGSNNTTMLSEVRFGESIDHSSGDIVICFPSSDDTVWSVAKRYAVPASRLSEATNYMVINS